MFTLTNDVVMFSCDRKMKLGVYQLDTTFNSFNRMMIVRELTFTIKEWLI